MNEGYNRLVGLKRAVKSLKWDNVVQSRVGQLMRLLLEQEV